MPKCFKCGSKQIVKNGLVFGCQRYKCKNCGYQFTRNAPAGKPIHLKMLTHILYCSGFSMRHIAEIIGVTAQSVSRWIKKWHATYTAEIGNYESFNEIQSDNLLNKININASDKCIMMQNNLPSGAEVFIIVKMPTQD